MKKMKEEIHLLYRKNDFFATLRTDGTEFSFFWKQKWTMKINCFFVNCSAFHAASCGVLCSLIKPITSWKYARMIICAIGTTQVETTPSDPIGSDKIRQHPTVGSDGIPIVGSRWYSMASGAFRQSETVGFRLSESHRIRLSEAIGSDNIRQYRCRFVHFHQ